MQLSTSYLWLQLIQKFANDVGVVVELIPDVPLQYRQRERLRSMSKAIDNSGLKRERPAFIPLSLFPEICTHMAMRYADFVLVVS